MKPTIQAIVSKEIEDELLKCSRCAYCVDKCPYFILNGIERVDARSQLGIIKSVMRGGLLTESVARNLFRCSLCKSCERVCPAKVKIISVIIAMRGKASEMGMSKFGKTISNILDTGNIFGLKRYRERSIPVNLEAIYFPGCISSYKHLQIVKATEKILAEAHIAYTKPIPENCCGFPLLVLGYPGMAESVMRKNLAGFIELGVEKIVTSCASCYWTMKTEYPKRVKGFDLEVLHVSELIHDLLNRGKLQLKRGLPLTATYHDPCFFGRYLDFYETPRALIENIKELTFAEMPHNRQNSYCCGGTGELLMAPENAEETLADYRVKEAMDVGADLIVTCCPFCYTNLSNSKRASLLPVVDLVEVIVNVL